MLQNTSGTEDPLFSHLVRWNNTARIKQFFSKNMRMELSAYSATDELTRTLPADFDSRDTLAKAQYLEDKLFLSNYLLSSQGDRMAMAHSVEIRPPFLDFRIIDFMSRVSPRWKILGLDEKHILKRTLSSVLPPSITKRTKHPYRAPIQKAFIGRLQSDGYQGMLSEGKIKEAGIFDPEKVARLFKKLDSGTSTSETEGMALAGIISTQLLFGQYIERQAGPGPADMKWDIHIDKSSR